MADLLRRDPDAVYAIARKASKRLQAAAQSVSAAAAAASAAAPSLAVEPSSYSALSLYQLQQSIEDLGQVTRSEASVARGLARVRDRARDVLRPLRGSAYRGGEAVINGDEALAAIRVQVADLLEAEQIVAEIVPALLSLYEQHARPEIYEMALRERLQVAADRVSVLATRAQEGDVLEQSQTTQDVAAVAVLAPTYLQRTPPGDPKVSGTLTASGTGTAARASFGRRPPYAVPAGSVLAMTLPEGAASWTLPAAEGAHLAFRAIFDPSGLVVAPGVTLSLLVAAGGAPVTTTINIPSGTYANATALAAALSPLLPARLLVDVVDAQVVLIVADGAGSVLLGSRAWVAATADCLTLGVLQGDVARGRDVDANDLRESLASSGLAAQLESVPRLVASSLGCVVPVGTPTAPTLSAGVQLGDRLQVVSADPGTPYEARWLEVIGASPVTVDQALAPGTYRVSVWRDALALVADEIGPTSAIQVASGAAQALLGLPTAEQRGSCSRFSLAGADLAAVPGSPIRSGDALSCSGTSAVVRQVSSGLLALDDEQPNDWGGAAAVYARGKAPYETYREQLNDWWRRVQQAQLADLGALAELARRSARDRHALEAQLALQKGLYDELAGYAPVDANDVDGVELLLDLLREQRLDRAAQLLEEGQLYTLCMMSSADASFLGQALTSVRDVAVALPDAAADSAGVVRRDYVLDQEDPASDDARSASVEIESADQDDGMTYG